MIGQSFTDAKGREWTLPDVTYGVALELRTIGLDIGMLAEDAGVDEYFRTLQNPMVLVPCLWIVCSTQAEERGVSEDEFGGELLGGDVIGEAANAFMYAVAAFFPPARRLMLLAAIGAPERIMVKQIEALTKQSGSLQVALDSILNLTPSVN